MKLPYFDIEKAFTEAKDSFSNGSNSDKVNSSAKLAGKSFANIGMFLVEAGTEAIKHAPEAIGKLAQENLDKRSHQMTDEQIERAQSYVEKANAARERRQEKAREDREKSDNE